MFLSIPKTRFHQITEPPESQNIPNHQNCRPPNFHHQSFNHQNFRHQNLLIQGTLHPEKTFGNEKTAVSLFGVFLFRRLSGVFLSGVLWRRLSFPVSFFPGIFSCVFIPRDSFFPIVEFTDVFGGPLELSITGFTLKWIQNGLRPASQTSFSSFPGPAVFYFRHSFFRCLSFSASFFRRLSFSASFFRCLLFPASFFLECRVRLTCK